MKVMKFLRRPVDKTGMGKERQKKENDQQKAQKEPYRNKIGDMFVE